MKTILFLVSGNGGTLKSVYYAIERLGWDVGIDKVISDRECGAVEFAKSRGLDATVISYSTKSDEQLYHLLENRSPDLVVTTVHKIITRRILGLFPGRFVNLHYSLLPAFGGLIGMQTVEEARKRNVKWVGATSHMVDEQVDHGKILGQAVVRVDWEEDDVGLAAGIVFRSACLVFIQSLMSLLGLPGKFGCQEVEIFGKSVMFNPSLEFDPAILDASFWHSLRC
jgi:phosphoribosylglycinamide formyltransferase 1